MEKITHIVFDHDGTLVNTNIAPRVLYPGIKDLLGKLAQTDVKLFVWTARKRFSVVEILNSLAIMEYFEELSTPDDAQTKPDTEGLEEMLAGIDPKNITVIGDSFADMLGGKKFGALCIGANWAANGSIKSQQMLEKYGADVCINSVEKLESFLFERI
ncbi:MAG: HAD-IA family hydrolase [Bdellovibrionota bacterium]|nr:HAD-IA family hydrolase [Bdellovibrionota bacterium]